MGRVHRLTVASAADDRPIDAPDYNARSRRGGAPVARPEPTLRQPGDRLGCTRSFGRDLPRRHPGHCPRCAAGRYHPRRREVQRSSRRIDVVVRAAVPAHRRARGCCRSRRRDEAPASGAANRSRRLPGRPGQRPAPARRRAAGWGSTRARHRQHQLSLAGADVDLPRPRPLLTRGRAPRLRCAARRDRAADRSRHAGADRLAAGGRRQGPARSDGHLSRHVWQPEAQRN